MKLSLTKRGDYGLRMLLYLAAREAGYRVTAAELAEGCTVPPGNVPTIVSELSRRHLLDCTSGPKGGCVLARKPEEISILEVFEVLEGPLVSSQCLLRAGPCDVGRPCVVHQAWVDAQNCLTEALGAMSLADATRGGALEISDG
jgi:Rrf2 family iron-sulfur cluster assembly transcriptional regulator